MSILYCYANMKTNIFYCEFLAHIKGVHNLCQHSLSSLFQLFALLRHVTDIRKQNFSIVSDVYLSFISRLVNTLNPFWNPHSALCCEHVISNLFCIVV